MLVERVSRQETVGKFALHPRLSPRYGCEVAKLSHHMTHAGEQIQISPDVESVTKCLHELERILLEYNIGYVCH